MKMPVKRVAQKEQGGPVKRRRKPLKDSELPPEAQELRRQFREWDESFGSPAKRLAYIRDVCERIARAYQPEKIILFGSHAYGQPTPESDVDLLIVMNYEGAPIEQSGKIRAALKLYTPMDLHVRTPKDIEDRLKDGDMFIREIVGRGKVMHEAKHG